MFQRNIKIEFPLPKFPLNKASARAGLRSLSIAKSCGFCSNKSRNTAGSSDDTGWLGMLIAPKSIGIEPKIVIFIINS